MDNLRGIEGDLTIPELGIVSVVIPLMVRHKLSPERVNCFVGRICSNGGGALGFDVLASESSSALYKFSLVIEYSKMEIRDFKPTDIPLMINWSWIGLEIKRKFFRTNI